MKCSNWHCVNKATYFCRVGLVFSELCEKHEKPLRELDIKVAMERGTPKVVEWMTEEEFLIERVLDV